VITLRLLGSRNKTNPRAAKQKAQLKDVTRGPIVGRRLNENVTILERYPLNKPFAYAVIVEDPEKKSYVYYIDELPLTTQEVRLYSDIINTLEMELQVPRHEVEPKHYFEEQARRVALKYAAKIGKVPTISWAKILYYAERDVVGFGPIDAFMRDPSIEDVSIDGLGRPVFIWHRKYESMEANLTFEKDEDLDNTIIRLVHMSGKHVSAAFPVVDATLPGRHRLSATFRREVSPHGSTVTIRKFREDPMTVIDLLNFGTLDHKIAAYAWLMMENRATAIVVGATASGKTTYLNALLSMVRPGSKIVTIEEVQEINISHGNWTPLVSRQSYGLGGDVSGEVSLFDLVKAAMRMRPDVLVVGEVRGEEAYALFQAISTGHGGLCSLHGDDIESGMQRLVSKPMDVAPAYIPFLDLVFTVRRVALPTPEGEVAKVVRRVIEVNEIIEFNKYLRVFQHNPSLDSHDAHNLRDSVKIRRLAKDLGVGPEEILSEIKRRIEILEWLQYKGVRNYVDLGKVFEAYHNNPDSVYESVRAQMEGIRETSPPSGGQ